MPLLNDVRVRSSEDKSMMSRSDGLRTGDMLTDLGCVVFFFSFNNPSVLTAASGVLEPPPSVTGWVGERQDTPDSQVID